MSALTSDQAEAERVRSLHELGILDTVDEERFDLIVRMTARSFGVPMVGFTLIDTDRQWSKASVGLPRVVPRDRTFCNVTIQHSGPLVVTDAATDDRFRGESMADTVAIVRFYAGYPVRAPNGHTVGTVCILDVEPRTMSPSDLDLLGDIARWIEHEIASDQELVAAAAMQQRLLPRVAPSLPGYRVAGRCLPARHVGGDFFDWYRVGDQCQFVIGDVMGKGIPAAMIAASVRALLRGASRDNPPGEAVRQTAIGLEPDLAAAGSFVTLFCARLDPATGRLDYVDAGHGLNQVIGADGVNRRLFSRDLPVGVVTDDVWSTGTTVLAPGEAFMSVSDGWLDLFDHGDLALAMGESFRLASPDPAHYVEQLIEYARTHDAPDDVTTIIVSRDPVSPPAESA